MNDIPSSAVPGSRALSIDLYQLTMVETYLAHDMTAGATFEFFARRLPRNRNYLVAAGLEQALDFLESFRFEPEEIDWLRGSGRFAPAFLDYLAALRFTGQVRAVPEGTVVFPHEPVIQVTAPLPEAQLVETRLINLIHFQTVIASKASRMITASRGRPLIDFGLRRAHGAEAGLLAARAAYLTGFAGTSNVEAGMRFGIPIFGTMAHSFVQAHDDERQAFQHFALAHPDNAVLLIDTYDTEAGAHEVVALARALAERGVKVRAVRLDSGDLAEHARRVRRILDDGGLGHVEILASSGIDETQIEDLVAAGAPIDGFAPGTKLDTSADAPYLDSAYKLVEYAGRPRFKRSEGKVLWPGAKQVHRFRDPEGKLVRDRLAPLGEEGGDGTPILALVMQRGRRLLPSPSLAEVRAHAARERDALPEALLRLAPADALLPEIAPGIRAMLHRRP